MKFLLDENVPISLKKVIQDNNAIILTLDSDFLDLNRNLQTKSRIVYIKIHPRDPVKLRKIVISFLEKYNSKLNYPFKLMITETNEVYELF